MEEVEAWVEVGKVKAHNSWWEAMGGRISYTDQQGNKAADKAAKEALKVAFLKAPTSDFNAALMRVVAWARWITTYAGMWADKTKDEEDKGEEAARRAEAAEPTGEERGPRRTLPHDLWRRRKQLLCRRCGRAKEVEGKRLLQSETCKGCVGGRVLAENTGNSNHAWAAYRWSEEELRASGYTQEVPIYIPEEEIWEEGLRGLQGTAFEAWGAVEDSLAGAEAAPRGGEEGGPEEGGPPVKRQKLEAAEGVRANRAHETALGRHAVRTRGTLTWCDICGAYATERAGRRIMGLCKPAPTRHTATRLARMRQGKHPISGELLC